MLKAGDMLQGLGFEDTEIMTCLKRNGLLSMELEFTKKCNLRCVYCYSRAGEALENELRLEELKSVIAQAKDLGASKIVLLGGGEPLMYHGIREIVEYIASLGLQQVLFTNGTLISEKLARFFFENKVSVVVKSNSLKPEVQDILAGVSGTFQNIRRGLKHLQAAGYPADGLMLGVQTVICRQNIEELPAMWRWAREEGFVPYFEMLTHQGRAAENAFLNVTLSEVRGVFEQLEAMDKEQFGIQWQARPTIAAFSCKRHLYSCLVTSQGDVQPCTGVDIPIGNVRRKLLKEILHQSPVIRDLRNIYQKIEGLCSSCEHHFECYGCRGNAYQLTGNYLASDPTCWRCEKARDEGSSSFC